jgi:SAM-dependent methyltransferase
MRITDLIFRHVLNARGDDECFHFCPSPRTFYLFDLSFCGLHPHLSSLTIFKVLGDNMTSSSQSDPLVPRSNGERKLIKQTLGGRAYQIDPTEVEKKNSMWKLAMRGGLIVLFSPILAPTAVLYTASMYCGPSWWRYKVINKMINTVMCIVADLFDEHRAELLQGIQTDHTVLDLGAGAGHYMKFLCKANRLIALEPIPNFHKNYRQKAIDAGMKETQIEVHGCVIESYMEKNPEMKASFDWVILGNVLCEVDNQQSTLNCVNQLLKPGGYVYFSEHVASPKGTWIRTLQDLVNPIWRTAGGGCNCNRDSLVNIRSIPCWQVIAWEYNGFQVGLGPFVLGLALKSG